MQQNKSQMNNADYPTQEGDQDLYNTSANHSKSMWLTQNGASKFLSASTLQHTIQQISFPKAERFQKLKPLEEANALLDLNLPSVKNTRNTSFGFGKKQILPQYAEKNAKLIPAPNKYDSNQIPPSYTKNMGKSFGLSHTYFRRAINPDLQKLLKVQTVVPFDADQYPSPCDYQNYFVNQKFGDDKLKYTMRPRTKMLNFSTGQAVQGDSKAQYLIPNYALTSNNRFKNIHITFQRGHRYDFTKNFQLGPGPAAYSLPSSFKTVKIRKKNINSKYNQQSTEKNNNNQSESENN